VRRAWPTVGALVSATFLQVALAPHMSVFGVVPNLLLLVVVTLAFVEGPVAGCASGFVAGAVLDLLGSTVIGPWALVLTVVGYLAGMLTAKLFAEGWLLPVTVVFVASLAAEASYGLVLAILGVGGPFFGALVRIMVPAAVYNTALAVLVYPWLARLLRQDRSMTEFRRLA
jgi:rod shape-determining protein MreD